MTTFLNLLSIFLGMCALLALGSRTPRGPSPIWFIISITYGLRHVDILPEVANFRFKARGQEYQVSIHEDAAIPSSPLAGSSIWYPTKQARQVANDARAHIVEHDIHCKADLAIAVCFASRDNLRWHILDGIVVFVNWILFSDLQSAHFHLQNTLLCCKWN